jgi:RNA recognition motif-containing protein
MRCCRFGFVNFVNHDSAREACDALDDTEWKGRKLFVGRAQKRTERDEELRKTHEEKRMENEAKSAGVNLYVKNLDGELRNASRCARADVTQTSGTMTGFELSLTLSVLLLAARS